MSCEKAQKLISPLLDRCIAANELESVLAHLASCAACAQRSQALENLRSNLGRMPNPAVPAHLVHKLRVLASHERVRQMTRSSWSTWMGHWTDRLELMFNNLMRPLALPFAGGLLSAVVVFCLIFVPSFGTAGSLGTDPAIELVSTPVDGTVEGAPGETPGEILRGPALSCDRTIVELSIDESGNVRDWNMLLGQMNEEVKNLIIYSHFIPATYFGYPVPGKVIVALHGAIGPRT